MNTSLKKSKSHTALLLFFFSNKPKKNRKEKLGGKRQLTLLTPCAGTAYSFLRSCINFFMSRIEQH